MIEWIFAAVLQASAAGEVACDLEIKVSGLSRRQHIADIDAGCPADVEDAEALQAAADAAIAILDVRRIRSDNLLTASEIYFTRNAAGEWQAVPGQIIITEPMGMPASLMVEGAQTMSCAWSVYPDYRGRARNERIACYVDGRTRPASLLREAENAIEDALRQTRFLPVDADYCFQDEVRAVTSAIEVTGGRFNNDNDPEPDMRPLPRHCG
jgi:hypothetical protein